METRKVKLEELKVNDEVLIVANEAGSSNEIGDIGVVTAIDADGVRVQVDGKESDLNWSMTNDVELIIKKDIMNKKVELELRNLYKVWIGDDIFFVFAENQSEAIKLTFDSEVKDEFITDDISVEFIAIENDFINK